MISEDDKSSTVALILEAVKAGARVHKCCQTLEISERNYLRWRKRKDLKDRRKGASKNNPRKLTKAEEDELVRPALLQ